MEVSLRFVVIGAVALLFIVGVVLLIGWRLPPLREGRAEMMIAAPPERVLAVIADVETQPEWRQGIACITLTPEGWDEVTARGETIRFVAEEMSVERVRLRFTSDRGYAGRWEAQLVPEGGGTRISVVERAEIRSPIGRILARLMFDPEAFATTYLAELRERSEG
jgi:hypothetical protein